MFDVTVKTLDGRDSVFTVDDEIKVEEFKSEIESKLDIPVAQQRLIFQGRVLPDNSRLMDCGVKDKVIHLVPRPPPTQGDSQSTPSSTGVTTNSTSTFGQIPLSGWDMRQTIQDITAGIFSGLGEFGRSMHIPVRANNEPAIVPPTSAALVSRERTFNRLYRQASSILHRISHTTLSPTIETSVECNSTSSEDGASSATVVNQATAEEESINRDTVCNTSELSTDSTSQIVMEPITKLPLIDSPMAVDQEPSRTSVADGEESVSSDTHHATPTSHDHPISVISSMLSRQRQLWRSVEPYLDQWETMLNAESQSQQRSSSAQIASNDVSQPSADSVEENTQAHMVLSSESVEELLPRETATLNQGRDGNHSEWHHRFFVQISRLLHLHAHMLHLISDFNVISVTAPQSNVTAPATLVCSEASGTTSHNVTTEASHNGEVVGESVNVIASSRSDVRRPHYRRVIQLPETEGHWIRARINVEPVNSTVRPLPNNPTAQSQAHTGLRGRPIHHDSADHRRSQSTSNLDRNRFSSLQAGLGLTQRSDQVQGAPMVPTSTHSGPFVTGGTAIIHRVDIPIISMNMINLPVSALEHLSAPSNAVAGHTNPVLTTTSTTDTSQSTAADQQSSEPSHRATEIPANAAASSEQSPHLLSAGPTDPFLVCHSRHFAHEHHHRIVLPFVPHSTAQIIPTGVIVPPSTQAPVSGTTPSDASGTVSSSAQQPVSVAEAETPTPASVTDATPINTARSVQSNLSQQIASFISSATNAVTSAASAGGFDLRPFNVFLSSPPIQLTSAVGFPNVSVSEPTTNTGTTAPGPWQSFSWMFGRENPVSSVTSNQSQPTPARQDLNHTPPPVLTTPSWGRGTGEAQSLVLTGSNRILNVFIEALIETIWSRLSRLAGAGGDSPSASFSVWSGSRSVTTSNQEISVGLLTDMLTVARSMLSSNTSDVVSPSSLDAMRIHLRHLIDYADSLLTNKDRLTETIVELIFGGNTSDENLNTDSSEVRAISWIKKRCEGGEEHLIDVRASLVRLFKANLSAQIELWRTSPTNYGFGSTLLWTIADFCVDCFCMVDLISNQLAKTSGLQAATTDFDRKEDRTPDSGEFHTLTDRLNAFAETLSHSQTDAQFVRFVLAGVNRCIDRYSSMDHITITRRWDHLSHACIVRRRLKNPSLMDVDNPQNQLSADDTDMDDLPFVDASSDLAVIGAQSEAETLGFAQQQEPTNTHDSVPDSCLLDQNNPSLQFISGKVSPLPEWPQVPNGSLESWTDGLRRHPDSVHSVPVLSSHLSPEGWHAVLPGDWINVVANDIETMNRSQSLTGVPDRCFSDAYIAGMPAKRRKVMQEHSRSLAQPPKTFFADCLSDAIRSCGCDSSVSSEESLQPGLISNSIGDSTEEGPAKVHGSVSDTDLQLVLCLRELVSERMEARLMSDPNFDPNRFPMSSKTFLKKQSPKD